MKKYSIGQFAKKINKTQQTLRNWDKSGKLKPEIVDESTVFSFRLQGKRAKKTKAMIKELVEND